MIPPVVASDRGRAQTFTVAMPQRGSRNTTLYFRGEEKGLENPPVDSERLVSEAERGKVQS